MASLILKGSRMSHFLRLGILSRLLTERLLTAIIGKAYGKDSHSRRLDG